MIMQTNIMLPSVLQSLVDHEVRDAGLLTVICGSTQHLMQGLALGPEAPLFGRMLAAIALEPMSPRALGQALGIRQPRECVETFAVWGGVPRYWELAEPFGRRLEEALEQLVLDPMGPLHLEPDRLLVEERPPALAVRPLLDAIGGGAHRVSEIAGRLGVPATSLARGLGRLVELGLVRRQQPFGESGRGGKRSLYVIADPFFRLWFRLVAPHRALLASGTRQTRLALWRKHRGALLAQAWEALCRQAVPRLDANAGPLAGWGGWTPAGRFWAGGGPGWDVVATSLDGRALLLGEVKWRDEAVTRDDLERACHELARKGVPPVRETRDDVAVVRAVFVPELAGRRPALPHDCHVVVAADVVKALG
jgi:AAA+ ATPase superfamily predicted ATPase